MDAVPVNLQMLAWLMGAVLTIIAVCLGAVLAYLLRNFLTRVEEVFKKVDDHGHRINTLEAIEGINN